MRYLPLLALLALVCPGTARADDSSNIEPQALVVRLESADPQLLVVDVRSATEFAEGHIPGAVNIPHDVIGERVAELGPAGERDIVAYCRSGRRSALAIETLKRAGFSRLFHLEGDYLRWSEEDRSILRTSAHP